MVVSGTDVCLVLSLPSYGFQLQRKIMDKNEGFNIVWTCFFVACVLDVLACVLDVQQDIKQNYLGRHFHNKLCEIAEQYLCGCETQRTISKLLRKAE